MKKSRIAIIWLFITMFTSLMFLTFNSSLKPLKIQQNIFAQQNSETIEAFNNNSEEKISTKRIYREDKIITTGTNNQGLEVLGEVDKIQFFGLPTYEETDSSNKKIQSFGIEEIAIKDKNGSESNKSLSLETIYANGNQNIPNNSFSGNYKETKLAQNNFNKSTIASKDVDDYANISLGIKNQNHILVNNIAIKLPATYNQTLSKLNNKDSGWENFNSSIGSIYIQSGENIYRSQSNIDIKKFLNKNTINLNQAPIKWSAYSIYGNEKNAFITIPKKTKISRNFVYTKEAQPEKTYSVPTPSINYVMNYKEADKENTYDASKWKRLIIKPDNIQAYNYLDFALVARDAELIKVLYQISSVNKVKIKNPNLIDLINTFNKEEFFNSITHNQKELSIGFAKKTKDTSTVGFEILEFLKFISWRDGVELKKINLYIKDNFLVDEITDENLKNLNTHRFQTKNLKVFNKIKGVEEILFEFNKSFDFLPLKIFGQVEDATIDANHLKTLDISTFNQLQTKQQYSKVFSSKNPYWIESARKDFMVIIPKSIGINSSFINDFKFKEDLSINNKYNQLLSFAKQVNAKVPTKPKLIFNNKTKQYEISTIKVDGITVEANIINQTLRYDFASQNINSKLIRYGNQEMTEFYTTPFTAKEAKEKGLVSVQSVDSETQKSFNITSVSDPIDYSVVAKEEKLKIDGEEHETIITNGHAVWNYDLSNIKYYTNNNGLTEYFTDIKKLINKVGLKAIYSTSSIDIKVVETNTNANNKYRTEWKKWTQTFPNYQVPNPSYAGVEIPYLTIDGIRLDSKFFLNSTEVWDWNSISKTVDISKIKWVKEEKIGNNQIIPHLFSSYKDNSGSIRYGINTFKKEIVVKNRKTPIEYNPWIKNHGKKTLQEVQEEFNNLNLVDNKKTDWIVHNGVFMFKEYENIKYILDFLDTKTKQYKRVFFTSSKLLNSFMENTKSSNTHFQISSFASNKNRQYEVKRFINEMEVEPLDVKQTITLDGTAYPVKLRGGMMYYATPVNAIKYKYDGKYYSSLEKIFKIVGQKTIDIEQLSMASYKNPTINNKIPFNGQKIFDKKLSDESVLKQNIDLIKKGIMIDNVRHSFDIYEGKVVLIKEMKQIKYVVRDSKTKEFFYYTSYSLIPEKYKEVNLNKEDDVIYSFKINTSMFYRMTLTDNWYKLKSPQSNKEVIIIREKVDGVITDVNILASNYKDPITNKTSLIWSNYNAIKRIKYFDGERYFTNMETAFSESRNFAKLRKVEIQVTNLNVMKELKTKSKKEQFRILIYPISLIGGIFIILFMIRLIAFTNNKIKGF